MTWTRFTAGVGFTHQQAIKEHQHPERQCHYYVCTKALGSSKYCRENRKTVTRKYFFRECSVIVKVGSCRADAGQADLSLVIYY